MFSILLSSVLTSVAAVQPEVQHTQESAKKQKPNIIYLLADDLGYGELGCYGQQLIETPHIDALASSPSASPTSPAPPPPSRAGW